MATLLRGNRKGDEVSVGQFCNDWFTVRDSEGKTLVLSPTSLQFTPEEVKMIKDCKNSGMLFRFFTLLPNGTFRKNNFLKRS